MSLFWMYWRRTLKKPAVIFLWGSLPFVFMTIYILVFGSSGKPSPAGLVLIDNDSTLVSQFASGSLSRSGLGDFMSVKQVKTLEEAEKLFHKNKASAALVIPEGFGENLLLQKETELLLYTNPRHFISPQILQGIIEVLVAMGNGMIHVFADPLQMIASFVGTNKVPEAEDIANISSSFFSTGKQMTAFASLPSLEVKLVEKKTEKAISFNLAAYFFPGLIVFALLSLSLSLEVRFLMDRINRLNNLIITAPKRPVLLVLNQRLYSILFLYIVAVTCALAGGLIWDIPPVGLIKINIMTMGVVIFIVGMNATIFSIAKTRKSSAALSSFIMIILIMVGGGIMPVEIYPATFQKAAHFTPTGLANTGIVQCLTGREVTISIPLLLAYCSAFLVISILFGRKRFIQSQAHG